MPAKHAIKDLRFVREISNLIGSLVLSNDMLVPPLSISCLLLILDFTSLQSIQLNRDFSQFDILLLSNVILEF